jgi:allophanate hydrolase
VANTTEDIIRTHRSGARTPEDTVAQTFARIRAHADPALFIALRDESEVRAEARALAANGAADLPLYGVPVAVKDNIDVAGLPTTAACPAFAYCPDEDATAVARLRRAGAIVIGKTNLDQFATGLVGVRSPYGIPRNALNSRLIPGGSSSGSATAVAAGLVPLALGTDTAGSGRVPAMLNNIVGLKPSLGLVSTFGVVPACRTLDCVSVFALTVDDAWTALTVIAGGDEKDAYSRPRALGLPGAIPPRLRIGVPRPADRLFFGDDGAAADYDAAIERLSRIGLTIAELDIAPFLACARMLYEGPWVAERYVATRALIERDPEALHPVTRDIILAGRNVTAPDAFAAFYRLEDLRRDAARIWADIDMLALPTAPTAYTVEAVLADPIALNSRLGTYTNFVNLLDLCGLAVPTALHDGGAEKGRLPFGITLLAPAGDDALLASVGRVLHADTGLPLGALSRPQPVLPTLPSRAIGDTVILAVVGAHLTGQPLNNELCACGARFCEATTTSPDYRFFALPGPPPLRPGLLRVAKGTGAPIEVELWALSPDSFGRFVAAIPPPLSIGSLTLANGRVVKSFLVEAEAITDAADISSFGGWRAYLKASSSSA